MHQSRKKNSPANSSKGSVTLADPEERKWVIIELSSTGEKEKNIDSIRQSARRILKTPDIDIFVPAISQEVRNDSQTFFYMDGYVFIEHRPNIQYLKLRETTFFRDVLCSSSRHGGKEPIFSLLSDSDLDPMRIGMADLRQGDFVVGDNIRVIIGVHKNLRGTICQVYRGGKFVQINVNHLRSKKLLIDYPSTYLEKIE